MSINQIIAKLTGRALAPAVSAPPAQSHWAEYLEREFNNWSGNPRGVPAPEHVGHSQWPDYLEREFNKEGFRILEIGSHRRDRFSKASYTGFDFYAGENVDVVGDAHKLAGYFENGSFDLIFSSAVFEHLYMPWIVAEEISKLLKLGGHVFIETHFSFSSHERPWNFFQFSDVGLHALFNSGLGFEIVDGGMSNPMAAFFDRRSDPELHYISVSELYCHSEILCKKTRDVKGFEWRNLSIDQIVDGTRYPAPA
jgi:hypothetical protein